MTSFTPARAQELREKTAIARKAVCEMSATGKWTMSIPPQPTDSDMATVAVLDSVPQLLDEIERLQNRVAELNGTRPLLEYDPATGKCNCGDCGGYHTIPQYLSKVAGRGRPRGSTGGTQ